MSCSDSSLFIGYAFSQTRWLSVFYVLCPLKDEEGDKEHAALALTKADFGKP